MMLVQRARQLRQADDTHVLESAEAFLDACFERARAASGFLDVSLAIQGIVSSLLEGGFAGALLDEDAESMIVVSIDVGEACSGLLTGLWDEHVGASVVLELSARGQKLRLWRMQRPSLE